GDSPLDKRGRSFIKQVLGIAPRATADIYNISGLQFEIRLVSLQNLQTVDYKSFGLVQRSAHHQDAFLEGLFSVAAPVGDRCHHSRVWHEADRPRIYNLTEDVDVIDDRGGKVDVVIWFNQDVLRE